jgi:hypothetical protein
MKNKNELITLFTTLNKQLNKGNAKFKYAILKNIKLITPEIETLRKIEDDAYIVVKDYNEKHTAIIRKYGTVEGEMTLIKPDSEYFPTAIKELAELKEEYKVQLEEYEAKTLEYRNLLNEDTTFEFILHKINPNDLPDSIESEDLGILMQYEIVD